MLPYLPLLAISDVRGIVASIGEAQPMDEDY
jgi:hypothetical protein